LTFNALDYLLMLILLLGVAWGMIRGAGKLLIGLFSLYVGLVASLLLYRPLGNFFRQLLPAMSVSGSQSLAFVVLLLVLVNGFSLLTRYFATPPEERKKGSRGAVKEAVSKGGQRFLTGPLNTLLGLILGFVVTVVWLSLILGVLQFFFRSGVSFGGGAGAALRVQLDNSGLLPWFNYALEQIYWSVSIWVPGGVPDLFANLLGQS
jgi:uncharacterized membrane protein required for colicin V production